MPLSVLFLLQFSHYKTPKGRVLKLLLKSFTNKKTEFWGCKVNS